MLVTASGFTAFLWVDQYTPTWRYQAAILAVGLGVGAALAPSTEAVMSAVPRAQAGAGSAVNTTMRLVGGALGVAVLGALLSTSYRSHLGTAVDVLPAPYRDAAAGSIGGTLTATRDVATTATQAAQAGQLTPAAGEHLRAVLTHLVGQADDAFVAATHVAVAWGGAVSALGALVALIWLPGRRRPVVGVDASASPDRHGESH